MVQEAPGARVAQAVEDWNDAEEAVGVPIWSGKELVLVRVMGWLVEVGPGTLLKVRLRGRLRGRGRGWPSR